MPAFGRRREVWLPTVWGLMLLLAAFAALAIAFAAALPSLLAVNAPAPGARVLIVEGWLEDGELDQAVAAYRRGHYERIVTTGPPLEAWFDGAPPWKSLAERSARYLAAHGLADATIEPVPSPPSPLDRTYHSALKVREWAERHRRRLDAVDVLTVGVHARRSRTLFRSALGPAVTVGVIAVEPRAWDRARWWASSAGAKTVLGESISVAWTACCFWPPAPGAGDAAAAEAAPAKLP